MQLKNKKVLVVGLGQTGSAVAGFLKKRGASVLVTDTADINTLGERLQEIRRLGIATELGPHQTRTFENADLIVLSPGVSQRIDPVVGAQKHGVPVMGEVELASRYIREPIVAVTGTNGKTTTTELLGRMLANSGQKVFVGGNIGNPLINYVDQGQKMDVIVAEISSFQLDTMQTFKPRVSVLLNIAPDHLDRYPNFAAYAHSKIRIFKNQTREDIAVLNGADSRIRALTEQISSQKLFFNQRAENEPGASLNGERIILHLPPGPSRNGQHSRPGFLSLSNTGLYGRHNLENACAASLAALAAGATNAGVQTALDRFKGLAHRLEYVATIDGVRYFNDSKATNVAAVVRALECFREPVVLIMGGRDKGGDFDTLKDAVGRRVRQLIVMGEAAGRIESILAAATAVANARSMEAAVAKARQAARPGDVVLLSPGCASFDMYTSYARRGEDFRRVVTDLKNI